MTQQEERITVAQKKLRGIPNLPDYSTVEHRPSWYRVKPELSWFDNGGFNAAYNAIDRHVGTPLEQKPALLWEDGSGSTTTLTFGDIAKISNQYANYLTGAGVKQGDRIFLFLPRIPALYCAFLGILKTGAIAGTMFSAFGEQALFDRLDNCGASILFTTQELSSRLASIKGKLPNLKQIFIVDNPEFISALRRQPDQFPCMKTTVSDYAFMLYTSGTTGKPKGVVHTHGAAIHIYLSTKWVLDIRPDDIYWCTADPGWVTGISYSILGPWMCGVTMVVHAGRFDPLSWYRILQKYRVTVWYTAPTAIRMLMANDDDVLKKFDLSSLRHLCSVGEPLNPEAIRWGMNAFGLPFHDTWWQTETGGILMANYPCMDIKVGSMGKQFPGIEAGIIDDEGTVLSDGTEGNLAFRPGWPSMMATIWHNEKKYTSYFINNWYISGDRAFKDTEGYFRFIGRADDVIKTSGERVGPFEVESALVEHPAVVEAGVIGKPDELRGEIIKAFVVLKPGNESRVANNESRDAFIAELQEHVKKHLAGHAYPREI